MMPARCEEGARVELVEPGRHTKDVSIWRGGSRRPQSMLSPIQRVQAHNQPPWGSPPLRMRNLKLTLKKSRLSDCAATTISTTGANRIWLFSKE